MRLFGSVRDANTLRQQLEHVDEIQAAFTGTVDPSTYPIASPWSSGEFQRIIAEDVFGFELPINTRGAAMRIGAIARGRNLLCSTISNFPLAAYRAAERLESPAPWMTAWGGGASPQLRLAYTVDDLIFFGVSCWARVNGADGFPLSFTRVNQGEWSVDADNRVVINGQPKADNEVTLIWGFHEGILSFGVDVLADARSLYAVVRDRLNMPVPPIDLHQTGGKALTNDEIDDLIDRWIAARKAGRQVGFTSEHIEAKALDAGDANLMIEARNAAVVDLARVIGVTAGMLDATAPKASLNYETQTGRNQEFVDRDLALYMTPIVARLSGDDVMPRGQRCAFDTADFIQPAPSPTGPPRED